MQTLTCFILCLIAGARSWENPWEQFHNSMGNLQQRIQANVFHTMDDIHKKIQDSFHQGSEGFGIGPLTQVQTQSKGKPVEPSEGIEMISVPAGGAAPRPYPSFNPMHNLFSQMQGMFNHGMNAPGFSGSGGSVHSFMRGGGPGHVSMFVSPPSHWGGPNVCVERNEEDESDKVANDTSPGFYQFTTSNCQEAEQAYVCTNRVRGSGVSKVMTTKYQCCYGYRRIPGQQGCQQTVDLKDMWTTLQRLGLNQFIKMIERAGLMEKLKDTNNTVFCPSDEAVMEFQENTEDNEVVHGPRVVRSAGDNDRAIVLPHILPGFVTIPDLVDEKLLQTEQEGVKIRANVYHVPETVYMINCARVISVDNFAINGVVHIVEKMIQPSTKSVADIISKDPQFSIFKSLLTQSGVMKDLTSQDGHFTVFAPTDESFSNMDPKLLEKLKRGEGCIKSIMRHHILPHTVCSGAIQGQAHARTELGSYLSLRRDLDNKLFIGQDCQVTARDVVATNGVVHFIDQVLMPRDARTPSNVLVEKNLTAFLDLLEETGMRETLDSMTNVTLFAPLNSAVMAIPEAVRKDPVAMENLVKFHLSQTLVNPLCGVDSEEQLPTILEKKTIRLDTSQPLSMLRHVATAQCARLVDMNNQACEASVQIVEKVLYPPEGNIPEVLSSSGNFTILRRLLQTTDLEKQLSSEGPYTLLAPTDQAFHSLPQDELSSLLNDSHKASRLLRSHILENILCCQSANPMPWYVNQQERALGGNMITVRRDNQGRVHFANAPVTTCDVMADNGVIHSIHKVISSGERRNHGFGSWFRFFNV